MSQWPKIGLSSMWCPSSINLLTALWSTNLSSVARWKSSCPVSIRLLRFSLTFNGEAILLFLCILCLCFSEVRSRLYSAPFFALSFAFSINVIFFGSCIGLKPNLADFSTLPVAFKCIRLCSASLECLFLPLCFGETWYRQGRTRSNIVLNSTLIFCRFGEVPLTVVLFGFQHSNSTPGLTSWIT